MLYTKTTQLLLGGRREGVCHFCITGIRYLKAQQEYALSQGITVGADVCDVEKEKGSTDTSRQCLPLLWLCCCRAGSTSAEGSPGRKRRSHSWLASRTGQLGWDVSERGHQWAMDQRHWSYSHMSLHGAREGKEQRQQSLPCETGMGLGMAQLSSGDFSSRS